ncbi:MAG: MFS transporter [Acidobacteriota bacterium]
MRRGTNQHGTITIVLHAVFVLSGFTTIMIGQVLPVMTARFSLNDLEAGYFFPSQFGGSLLGTYLTSWFGRNHKYVPATVFGCLFMAGGVLLMNSSSYYTCLIAFALNGIGFGLTLPSVNMLVLEMNLSRPASALNILNFCWGVGAILCKPFIDIFSSGTNILTATLLIAGPLMVTAGLTAIFGKGVEIAPILAADTQRPTRTEIWTTSIAWILALFNFIHVGFESGIGGWLTTYSERIDYDASVRVLSPTFVFFVFFVLGRGVAPLYLRFLNENRAILLGLALILAGMAVTLAAHSTVALLLGAVLSGFGTSSIFPTSLARFGRIFGNQVVRRAMPLFIAGNLGSIAITWLIGFFSNRVGDLRAGMYVLAVSVILLIVIQVVISSRPSAKQRL